MLTLPAVADAHKRSSRLLSLARHRVTRWVRPGVTARGRSRSEPHPIPVPGGALKVGGRPLDVTWGAPGAGLAQPERTDRLS